MSYSRENPTRCSTEGCTASHPSSHWDSVRADREGWFHQKDGTTYCPEHRPAWVDGWRARQAKG